MLRNAADLASGSVVHTDVCVVGTGPAGQTLAREFAGSGFKVLVLESGDHRRRRKLKQLNEGETFGDQYQNPRWQRERRLGGTPNRWVTDIGGGTIGARFVPLDPVDFEKRETIAHSGWPISRGDLDPFYERAQQHMGVGPYRYDVEAWKEPGLTETIETTGLETTMFQFGPKSQWTDRTEALFNATSNIDLLVNATVVELDTNDSGDRVTVAKVVNEANAKISVHATIFLLAVGCIETSRLLLNSRRVHKNGLGNSNDVVGRYFMDHPQSYLNSFTPRDRRLFDTLGLYDRRKKDSMAVMAKLTFKQELMRREQIPNCCYVLFPRRDHFLSPGFLALFSIILDIKSAARPVNLGKRVMAVVRGAPDLIPIAGWWLQGTAHYPYVTKGGWAHLADKSSLFTTFEIWSLQEQQPHPDNRIRLSERRDYNGTPIVAIDWRFTEADKAAVLRQRELFKQEIEGADLGTITWSKDVYTIPSSVHPIGGARMGRDAKTSVVNEHLEVHGVPNLLIASSAVFPTSGYANPTLTVVALACRAADHVKRLMASGVANTEPSLHAAAPLPSP